ncbi:ribonuclease E inhibitor RraB [Pontivivens ytuae]|uniref:Uncharacterized protein n=1 Tax=Pontivivens ytuae TaxID=2789856 RepID=A0A7S9LTV6_9RHOB|nr:ribonuclease E inhibitor RraB [Pontivivens ytuae]QPH55061.1 hypothetical protein I0K15_04755 [Pontivivens ytuae]
MSDWDYEHQKAVTALTLKQIAEEGDLDEAVEVTLDLEFLPGDGADAEACAKALTSFGYEVEVQEDGMISASIGGVPLTLDGVWTQEERATKIALTRGYTPDGWGFWEP